VSIPVVCLGIDPGLASLGWGVVSRVGSTLRHLGDGTIHTKPDDGTDEARAAKIGREVRALLDDVRPNVVALERWVFYPEAEPHQAHALGLVIGALLAQFDPAVPLVMLRAVDLRTSLGLAKSAAKDATRARVEAMIGARGRSQHSADALGVAIVGATRGRPTRAPFSARRWSPDTVGARISHEPNASHVEVVLTPAQRAGIGRALLAGDGPVAFTLAGIRLTLTATQGTR
jgi:crossover junction endodeoxyribonuclease RuvC